MELTKTEEVDRIDIVENAFIQVRTKITIMEDGKQISMAFHRHVVMPGDDYSAEDDRVKTICAAVHTPEVIAAYQASKEAARLPA